MMFYWLDSFVQCLMSFFHQGMGSNPTFRAGPIQSAGRHDVSGPYLWPACVWPVSGRHLTIIDVRRINFK
jgi:hypothetical protein